MSTTQRIEVQVFDGATPTLELAVLSKASSVTWQEVLGDVGSGSFELAWSDPKATAAILHEGNLIKLFLGGQSVFSFFIEAPVLTMAEAGDSRYQIAGSGGLSYLSRAAVYPPGWPTPTATTRSFVAPTPGTILKTLIDEAQARGTIPNMTYDFTAALDSRGVSWAAMSGTLLLDVATTNVLDVAKKLAALGIGIWMDPNLVLHAYAPGTFGANNSGTVIFRHGKHIVGPVPNTGNGTNLQTVVLVAGAGGAYAEAADATQTGNPYIGRREGGLNFSSSADPTQMTAAGNQQIALSEARNTAITVPLNHGPQSAGLFEPYSDYHIGDTVAIDVPPQYALFASQIVQLTVQQQAGGDYWPTIDLGTVVLPDTLTLSQQMASSSGTTSQTGGGIAGNLTLANPKPTAGLSLGGFAFTMASSFPGSPSTGDLCFRTDLGILCEYTANGWLGPQLPYALIDVAGNQAFTVTGSMRAIDVGLLPTQAFYCDQIRILAMSSANSGSAFWAFQPNKVSVANANTAIGVATNTKTDTASNWVDHSIAIGALIGVGYPHIEMDITKTSTPGNLYVMATVLGRIVYT